ncbi:MAG: right-handed parallel beta-helix repeat-containing protein [Jiangellaceae bacterium]
MGTVLFADDFGCVPDGRFLEKASIDEGSALLNELDGGLRATDVGKTVAIPGAADLEATISELVDRLDVTGQMTAGQFTLEATFPPEESRRFRTGVHDHWRITVDGAGPAGGALVTDVKKVLGSTRLELVDPAAASVAAAPTTLNDPTRVALSDYARNSVTDVTVTIGDRTVDDAAMIVGQATLSSATAKFTVQDLGTPVTVRAAGRHVTTIQSFHNSTQVKLTAPATRTVDSGQADVWRTDSRPGIEALLASLSSLEVEAAEIRFGSGVYDFTRVPVGSALNAAIALSGRKNLTLRGAGPGATILRLMPSQDLPHDTHVVQMQNCTRLTVHDLSIHGAYLTMGTVNEQMHGILIDKGSAEITVDQVRVYQTAGDGIRFLGSADERVRRVWVNRCQIVQNKRTGVAFQRCVEQVWLRDCYIEMNPPSTDACLDFEPTGTLPSEVDALNDIVIDSNLMVHGTETIAVSLSGLSGQHRLVRLQFSNNFVLGGSIFCTDVEELTIRNNVVVVPETGPARITLNVQRGGRDLLITGNTLVNDRAGVEAVLRLSEVNERPVARAVVADNLCIGRARTGIALLSSDDIAVHGNMVVSTGDSRHGIFLHAESSDMDSISVRDNHITVKPPGTWLTGIRVAASPQHVDDVSIVENSIRGATDAITFDGAGFRRTPVCALNQVSADAIRPLVGLNDLPEHAVVVGGAVSRGGGRHLTGIGDPAPTGVVGDVGDIFQRLDGHPGQTLYVKESGNGTATGWTAK